MLCTRPLLQTLSSIESQYKGVVEAARNATTKAQQDLADREQELTALRDQLQQEKSHTVSATQGEALWRSRHEQLTKKVGKLCSVHWTPGCCHYIIQPVSLD